MERKTITLLIRGERALFRNLAVPGLDVADSKIRERAIKGIIGNMLGLWRDFNNPQTLEIAASLDDWWNNAEAIIREYEYSFDEQVSLTQHRYKGIKDFTKAGKSAPRRLTYHFGSQLRISIELNDFAHEELLSAVKTPIGLPYMGQSNCLAQIHIQEIK